MRHRPFLQITRRDVQTFKRLASEALRVELYKARRSLCGYGTLDEIAQIRREMFAEIMGGPRYRQITAYMKAVDVVFGTSRVTPAPPLMRSLREEMKR